MTTLQEAEMTRRRWERSISQGWSNEIGEVDRALSLDLESLRLVKVTFDISKILRPVLGAWQTSWAPTIEKSKARIATSRLSSFTFHQSHVSKVREDPCFQKRFTFKRNLAKQHFSPPSLFPLPQANGREWLEWQISTLVTCLWVSWRWRGGGGWRCWSRSTRRTAGGPSSGSWCWAMFSKIIFRLDETAGKINNFLERSTKFKTSNIAI